MKVLMTIGQIARAAGASVETIRFYEREGLIGRPARSASGYRNFAPEAVRRLRFIRQAKELGFSLGEIKELLALRVTPTKSCGDVRVRAEHKIAEVNQRIAALKRIRGALVGLAAACTGRGPTTDCPILEALESGEPL
jgi:MerR family mercuric resistance operon transcriptional regulator